MENKYTKLSDLIGGTFTINKFYGYKWKKWDNENKKMLISDTWQKDYRKIYGIETDKGSMDLSANQVGILLEAIVRNGEANLIGRTFQVKSNGKTGMEIRYFFNPVASEPVVEEKVEEYTPDQIDLNDIPF